MTKYISVFEPQGDGVKDRGEKQLCLVCSGDGIRKARGIGSHITIENFPLSKIARVDCYRGDQMVNNMASGAAVGFLLGGTRGAIVGSLLSGGDKKAWWVEIELTDGDIRFFRMYQDDSRTFLKWANKYGVKVAAAEIPEVNPETPVSSVSGADEIMKYKQLLDQGIITQEEFDAKKQQLLGL